LISSDEYDTTVSSILTIGNFSTTFRITTQTDNSNDNTTDDTTVDDNSSSNLSTTEKLQIAMIFTTIKDMYTDSSARTAFMNTLLNEIQVKIDSLNQQIDNGTSSNESADQSRIDALQYLYDIVDSYLGGNVNTTSTSTLTDTSDRHIAPNGRVYMITYDSVKHTYTSPDFMFPKSFATVAAMIAYIDVNNGGA